MRIASVLVPLGALVLLALGWPRAAAAQPTSDDSSAERYRPLERAPHLQPLERSPRDLRDLRPLPDRPRADRLREASRVHWTDQLLRDLRWVPGVLVLVMLLARRDPGAWWFVFLALIAGLVVFGGRALVTSYGPWLQSLPGTIIATVALTVGGLGLFALHQRRLDIYARTEITFAVVGIGYSVNALEGGGGAWATLILSAYGLVEGLGRLREAGGETSLLGLFDPPAHRPR